MLTHLWQSHSLEMHFVWTSPWRVLLVFAADVHGITIRLSCSVCGNLALASVTMWAGDPPTSGTHFQVLGPFPYHRPLSSSNLAVPSRHWASPAASAASTAVETPEMLRASWHPASWWRTSQPWRRLSWRQNSRASIVFTKYLCHFPPQPQRKVI